MEVGQAASRYDTLAGQTVDVRERIRDYEEKLRYANDVIANLEAENQAVNMDIAAAKATIQSQHQAQLELKYNFQMLSSSSDSKGIAGLSSSTASPIVNIPKIVMPSQFYKPSIPTRSSVNLMPSTSKGLS
mmetsp:Transcript_34104/g.25172  ORF Transcript_34104/g.25172 Transcript_34104/m.25172 type:complete len:131 (+) Transcript_34104:1040-1432(+)